MIDLNLLKLSNIFGQQQPSPNLPFGSSSLPINDGMMNSQPQTQGPDLITMIQSLLNPREEQFSNFESMINQMPNRADYKPSKWRNIAAAIAGMGTGGPAAYSDGAALGYKSNIPGGLEIQRSIRDEPYNRALTDWSNKIEPISKIAQMESNRNINNRATALGVIQRQTAQEKQDETERANLEKERINQEKLKIQQQRANVYEYKARNPDLVIKEDNQGNLIGINPKDGTSDVITDNDGQPVKSSVLTDTEKIKLQTESNKKLIAARGEQSRLTAETTAEARKSDDWELFITKDDSGKDVTVRINRSTGDVKPVDVGKLVKPSGTGNAARADNPTQQKVALANLANNIKIQHPEWSKYIKVNKGDVSVNPPGSRFNSNSPDQATYDAIVKTLGLSSNQPKSPSPASQPQSRELTRPTKDLVIKGMEVGKDPLRDEAISLLQKQGKPLTGANIEYIKKQLEKR